MYTITKISNRLFSGSKKKKRLFGESLPNLGPDVDLRSVQGLREGIPQEILWCMEYLEQNGTKEQGIFRLAGSIATTKKMKDLFDKRTMARQEFMNSEAGVHEVASLLKLYFRELPEPLLTFEMYDCFIAAQGICVLQSRLECIKKVLRLLPRVNMCLLHRLVTLLAEIDYHSDENKMTRKNLAIVFAPNLLRSHSQSQAEVYNETSSSTGLMEVLIAHKEFLFKDAPNLNLTKYVPQPESPVASPPLPPRRRSTMSGKIGSSFHLDSEMAPPLPPSRMKKPSKPLPALPVNAISPESETFVNQIESEINSTIESEINSTIECANNSTIESEVNSTIESEINSASDKPSTESEINSAPDSEIKSSNISRLSLLTNFDVPPPLPTKSPKIVNSFKRLSMRPPSKDYRFMESIVEE